MHSRHKVTTHQHYLHLINKKTSLLNVHKQVHMDTSLELNKPYPYVVLICTVLKPHATNKHHLHAINKTDILINGHLKAYFALLIRFIFIIYKQHACTTFCQLFTADCMQKSRLEKLCSACRINTDFIHSIGIYPMHT